MARILQVTDPHLGVNDQYRLAGVDTLRTFKTVLDEVKKEDYDMVLATGDIASEASTRAYASFFDLVADMGAPVYWLPGNHDLLGSIAKVQNATEFVRTIDIENWRILMLDSVIEHNPNGRLGPEELDILRKLLAENTQEHVLVCLHHQPVDVGSAWLDNQKIDDAQEFLGIVENDPNVRGVLWGHVHQEFSAMRDGRLFFSTPSTCIQFKANSDDFALDDLYPGYRMIDLNRDGSIDTEVKRVPIEDYGVDIDCAGY